MKKEEEKKLEMLLMKKEEEGSLEVLPANGLLTLHQLSIFLGVGEAAVKKHFNRENVPMLPYSQGRYLISLDSITNMLRERTIKNNNL